jgi:hypothetical protein
VRLTIAAVSQPGPAVTDRKSPEEVRSERRHQRRPARFLLGYFMFTLLLYFFGPISYPTPRPLYLLVVLSLYWLAFALAYNNASRGPIANTSVGRATTAWRRWVRAGAVINIAITPILSVVYTGQSIGNAFFRVGGQGEAYSKYQSYVLESIDTQSRLVVSFFRSFVAPAILFGLIVGIRRWKELDTQTRLLVAGSVLSQLLFSSLRGTDKEGVDLVVYVFVGFLSSASASQVKRLGRAFAALLLCVVLAFVFIGRRSERYSGNLPGCFTQAHICVDRDATHWDERLGETTYLGAGILSSYIVQGYYGYSLSMELPFKSTYGVGNSAITMSLYRRLTGNTALLDRAYTSRSAEVGWDTRYSWSSLFVWIANDFSIWGVMPVMAMIGMIMARCWKKFRLTGDEHSYLTFVMLFIVLLYSPVNNQLGTGLDTYVGAFFVVGSWIAKNLLRNTNRRSPEKAIDHGSI